ncbi:lipid-A-disaccharide synthase N-terminal domain-containing protein [Amorphus sp. MBR-141]
MGSDGTLAAVADWFHHVFISQMDLWLILGFAAQAMFSMRFLVQWIASEKARRSVVPVTFWFFSLGGGAMLLAYAVHQKDPVFIAGQAAGLVIYVRNLWLIMREHRAALVKTD